jgi:RecA-family ATPase
VSGVIAAFNAQNPLEEMLERHGYEQGGGDNWKSPMASSGYSTQVSDDGQRWRSLSESDAAAGIGAASKSGDTRTGDAFDVYVYFEHKGNTKEALRRLHAEGINADERLGSPPPSSPGDVPAPPQPPEAFTLADLTAWSITAPRPKPFVMPGFIPARELTLATGAGGANKSTFGQQLATCCAAGIPMLGIDVMPVNALYITAEDDEDRLHWMQAHICNAVGIDIASLSGKLHLASLRGRLGNEIATFGMDGTLHPSASFALLRATIEQTQAGLVVLDNAAHLFVGNENDRQQVTAFVNLLYSLCRDLGATVILVAHTNKAGDSYSGSTAWLNAVRSQIILERPEGSPDPDERVLLLGKANYARQGQEVRFRWRDFALVRDEDLPPEQRAEIFATVKAAAVDERFLRCLAKTKEERRAVSVSSSAANYAPRIFSKMSGGKEYTPRDYAEALERLLHAGTIANGLPIYQRDNRAWVHGLGVAEECTNPCTDPAQSDAPTRTDPS